MKTAIFMIALIASTMFAFPLITAVTATPVLSNVHVADEVLGNPDFNLDGFVDDTDKQVLLDAWGACADKPCIADLDNDGSVGSTDLMILLGAWNAPGNPDFNFDGFVDGEDRDYLLSAWGPCNETSEAACKADLNGDGNVGSEDLLMLLGAWSTQPIVKAIPSAISSFRLNEYTINLGEDEDSDDVLGTPTVSNAVPVVTDSETVDEIADEVGITLTNEDLEELELDHHDARSLIIAIVFHGPNVKGVLFEKRTGFVDENGERTLFENKAYRGIVITSEQERYFVKGEDMSTLALMSRNPTSASGDVQLVDGRASFHFSENANSVTLHLNTAEQESFKLDKVKRVPVRNFAHGQDVIETDNEKTPFLKRFFNSDDRVREVEPVIVTSSDDLDSDDSRAEKRTNFMERIRSFFERFRGAN